MPGRDALATAFQRFTTHPLQTWLTLTGLLVGTASLIFMTTLGLTGRGYVQQQIEGVGSHLLWAKYEGTVTGGVARKLDDTITDADARAAAARTDVFSGVTSLAELNGQTSVHNRSTEILVLGAEPNYGRVRKNLRILKGRFLDEDDLATMAKVCIVNRQLYEELYGSAPVQGQTLRTLGMAFDVIGEFEEPVDTLGQGDVTPRTIFVPITVAWLFKPRRTVDTLFAEVHRLEQVPTASATLRSLLSQRHHAGSEYHVESMTAVLQVANAISLGLLVVFVLVAAVSVIVGGVGIMNIMLASVEHRIHEIGLRKAIGARRRDVLAQFLLEGLLLGAIGAGLGVALGLAVPLAVRALAEQVTVRISWLSAALAFLFSAGVTLVFAVAPAWRAASIDPVEALRHE